MNNRIVKKEEIESQKKRNYKTKTEITSFINYENQETGKIDTFEVKQTREEKDELDKIGWRRNIVEDYTKILLDITENKMLAVVHYLIQRMNNKNAIEITQEQVIKDLGISVQTVNSTFKALVKQNLLKKVKGKYVINPYVIGVRGNQKQNTEVIKETGFTPYRSAEERNLENKLERIRKQKEVIEAEEKELMKKLGIKKG
jgi:hypothetical protein